MNARRLIFVTMTVTVAALAAAKTMAAVKPHALFSDNAVLQRDLKVPVWGTAAEDEKVTVKIQGQEVSATAKDGKWRVELAPLQAGGPFEMTIAGENTVKLGNILVGEVWIASGQSNMQWSVKQSDKPAETIAASTNPQIRLLTVPRRAAPEPQTDVDAKWFECGPSTVGDFSAVAYFFGADLAKNLKVPVGLISTNVGGTPAEAWTSREAIAADPTLKAYHGVAANANSHSPSGLFNAMINPLVPYAIRGAIWYQGESNAGRAAEYYSLMPTMIEDWRKQFRCDLPFYLVQLAPFHAGDADGAAYAELRDAQRATTTSLKNVGMAVITDIGDLFDIHPQNKEPVGTRLALAARALTYGQKIDYTGPVYKSMVVDGSKAVLSFDLFGGGLVARGLQPQAPQVLNGFSMCGEDKYFYPAKAVVKGETVVVTCEKVSKPIAVRYGWSNFPVCNLCGKANLPASPFRTDDFPLTTQYPGKKSGGS